MSNKHLHQLGLVVALGSLVINVCSLAYHAKHLCPCQAGHYRHQH